MTLKRSFAAVIRPDTRLLILGSLPGERSLAEAQYYAHPGNRFWELAGAVIERDLRALAYPDRLVTLLEARVGLWDSIGSARRAGSLDSAIREHRGNELAALVEALPELRGIGFNGATSARIGRAQLAWVETAMVDLPSSSAANASQPYAMKLARWLGLRAYL